MPSRKPQKSGARSAPVAEPVSEALTAARRALRQQTARVTELEARLTALTARPEPTEDLPGRIALTDTEIYRRQRRAR